MAKLNKYMLITSIVAEHKITRSEALYMIDTVSNIIKKELLQCNEVAFGNLCTFKTMVRKDRVGVNPATKTRMIIPSKRVAKITVHKRLREDLSTINCK